MTARQNLKTPIKREIRLAEVRLSQINYNITHKKEITPSYKYF